MRLLYNRNKGKLRVVGFVSGSGNTLWKAYELQKELEKTIEGSPFEVVGIFSSKLENKALDFAKANNIPYAAIDIKEFYKERNAKITDMEVRAEFDKHILREIASFKADIVFLAGYVWATTDVILDNYTLVNVHPADLSIMKDGRRAFAGPNGVGDALEARAEYIASSSHIATPVLDDGPILIISPKIPVDYTLDLEGKDFMRHYLKQVNAQSRNVGARTIYEIAVGNFAVDENNRVHYKGKPVEDGVRIDDWEKNILNHERNIKSLFEPKSVAVIGASAKGGLGNAIVKNIQATDFKGEVYAVNRNGETVQGAKGYSSVKDIENDVDLAIITIPSNFVLDVARECGEKGVDSIVCITAGFKELGEEGAENEKKLIDIVDEYNMRLMGPNCMGILNTAFNFNATMLHNLPEPGNIAFITQSGALGAGILDYANDMGLGFSVVASLGNQADITINDIIPYLEKDESTQAILLYLETLTDIPRFIESASRIAKDKPIVLIKSGRTEAGAKAASSHTGSLSENDEVLDAIIRKCGIIRVKNLQDAFNAISAVSKSKRPKGKNIAVITNAGGPGILLTDSLHDRCFELPLLEAEMVEVLREQLLPEAAISNPIDLVAAAPPSHYNLALKGCIESGKYDAVAVVCVPPAVIDTGEVASAMVETIKNSHIPVYTSFLGPTLGENARNVLNKNRIANFDYPEQIANVLDAVVEQDQDEVNEIVPFEPARKFNFKSGLLNQKEGMDLIEAYGFKTPKSAYITEREFGKVELSFPVVAKIDHPEITHKSDVGGVILNIGDEAHLNEVVNDLYDKFDGLNGVIVQEQIKGDLELLLGANWDTQTGHSIFLGLGGVFVEILKDYSIGHVPVDSHQIDEMIKSLKSYKILEGYRGNDGIDIAELAQYVMNFNQILLDYPMIKEVDLNPLKFDPNRKKLYVVDTVFSIK